MISLVSSLCLSMFLKAADVTMRGVVNVPIAGFGMDPGGSLIIEKNISERSAFRTGFSVFGASQEGALSTSAGNALAGYLFTADVRALLFQKVCMPG